MVNPWSSHSHKRIVSFSSLFKCVFIDTKEDKLLIWPKILIHPLAELTPFDVLYRNVQDLYPISPIITIEVWMIKKYINPPTQFLYSNVSSFIIIIILIEKLKLTWLFMHNTYTIIISLILIFFSLIICFDVNLLAYVFLFFIL